MTDPDAPAVQVRDGSIFWRGVYKSREEAERLRDEFARKLPAGDWFAPQSKQYAEDLTKALWELYEDAF